MTTPAFDPVADRLEEIAPVIAVQCHDLMDRVRFWLGDSVDKMATEAHRIPHPAEWVLTTPPFLATAYIAGQHGAMFTYSSRPVWSATSNVAQGLCAIQAITESIAREVHGFAGPAVEAALECREHETITVRVDVPAAADRVQATLLATVLAIVDDNNETEPTRRTVREED